MGNQNKLTPCYGVDRYLHPSQYVHVIKHCLHCGKRIPGRGGLFCWADECQEARKARKRATEKAWVKEHKPWRKRNYEHSSKIAHPKEQAAKVKRYCQYRYCQQKQVPLPKGWRYYHPSCHQRLVDIVGRGLDSAYGVTL